MSADLSLDIIKTTQNILGQFVKKPPLSEKLLKKPPFRFLHDIITAVMRNTGFFNGLFTEEELISENVKDREKKIAFLQKVIQVVNLVTDTSLSVRPSKIISGQEPEKTNELLQKIGEALAQNLSSVEAVEKITGGKNISKKNKEETLTKATSRIKTEKSVAEPKIKDKSDDKRLKNKTVPKPDVTSKSKTKTSDGVKKKKPSDIIETRDTKQKLIKESSKQLEQNNIKKIEEPVDNEKEIIHNSIESDVSIHNNGVEINEPIMNDTNSIPAFEELSEKNDKSIKSTLNGIERANDSEIKIINELPEKQQKNNSSDIEQNNTIIQKSETTKPEMESYSVQNKKEILNIKNESNDKTDEDNKPIQRTKSHKPEKIKNIDTEPKIKNENQDKNPFDNSENIENTVFKPKTLHRPSSVRPSSSRPSAPRFKDTNVDVILTTDPVCKAKVNIIAENYDKQAEDDDGSIMIENSTLENDLALNVDKINIETSGGTHGHLVQQILETQKELDGDGAKVEIEWEWGARREREASFKEIETLRNGLQTLSRAANPLGKLMDYVQEDVEIMRQELLHWRDARKKAAAVISQQENQIEKSIQPLEAKLKQLEDSISDQLELIYTVKSNIFRNDLKIKKILSGD